MTKKRSHFSAAKAPAEVVELAVLNLGGRGARCLQVSDGSIVFYRGPDEFAMVAGAVITVQVKERGRQSGQPFVSGKVLDRRLDTAKFGRPALALDLRAAPDLDRKAYSLERAVRRLPDGEDSADLIEELDPETDGPDLWKLSMTLLEHDVRSIEAHAALGDILLAGHPQDARAHYLVGASFGEWALAADFDGVLPWRFPENRALLHCLCQVALCDVIRGDFASARPYLERVLALDPDDGHKAAPALAQFPSVAPPDPETRPLDAKDDEVPPRVPVRAGVPPVDLSWFVIAFESNDPEMEWFIDLQTGEVIPAQEGGDEDLLPMPLDEMRESERFVLVEPDGSHEAYEDMQEFALDCDDERLRKRLLGAIEGKGAFRRFKDALLDHPAARERWFALKDERLAARARRWLEDEGIPYVEKKGAKA